MATYKSIRYLVPDEVVEHTDSINALADVNTSTVAPEVGQTLKWSAANSRWQPADIEESSFSTTQKAIFSDGESSNLVSSTGVVASDSSTAGTYRQFLGGSTYGGDKAIIAFGQASGGLQYGNRNNVTNLVSNTGVMASNTTVTGAQPRMLVQGSHYGGDKAIFAFGAEANEDYSYGRLNVSNLVSNTGFMSSDITGVGSARSGASASSYGGDKAIFGYGEDVNFAFVNTSNLVSNTGVVASDTTGVGSNRFDAAGAGYGGDKGMFGFGSGSSASLNVTNLISNTGIVSSDTTGVGTARDSLGAAGYGGDKAIFGFGGNGNPTNVTNLVTNTGVVGSDQTGVGTARAGIAAAGFSSTA